MAARLIVRRRIWRASGNEPCIVQSRGDREGDCRLQSKSAQYIHPHIVVDLLKQHPSNRSDLREGIDFPEDARFELTSAHRGPEDRRYDENAQISPKYESRNTDRDQVQVRKHQKKRAEK